MFKGYVSDLSAIYDDYVETLPANGYSSDGSLLVTGPITSHRFLPRSGYGEYDCANHTKSTLFSGDCLAYSDCNSNFMRVALKSGHSSFQFSAFTVRSDGFLAPYSGYYQLTDSLGVSGVEAFPSGDIFRNSEKWKADASPVYYEAGSTISARAVSFLCRGTYYDDVFSVEVQFYPPVYKFVPISSVDLNFDATYNINTRPTSITDGNYGIVGDNGQITKIEDNSTIINETNNTYYNPATGQTVPISNWSYDYSDRSYKVTLESGDTATITYGDENITIQEGDTVYNVYYLVDGTGNPPCEHDWQEGEATVPTCVRPGSASYVCSLCGQTKTESIPALGHNWQVKQTVTTQYDDTGQLVQAGYTIFECSTCHEQYKSTDGTIPPGGGSGTDPGGEEKETIWDKLGKLFGAIGGGIIGMIEAAAGKVLDALISLVEQINEKLKTVIETVLSIFDELPKIFGGFLDFLAAVFPFLPAELMTILTFGILAVVFIGIIKAVRR